MLPQNLRRLDDRHFGVNRSVGVNLQRQLIVVRLLTDASFLDQPFNPSPYAPVSRLFWNEFYLDLERIPGFQDCPEAKSILNATNVESLRAAPLVQYREVMARKRAVFASKAARSFSSLTARSTKSGSRNQVH